jgi:putative ABC transport system substrate-binding protein
MNRRELLFASSCALGAIALSRRSFAQTPGKVWRVGILTARVRPASLESDFSGAFMKAMRELGYVEGKSVQYEWRFSDGKYEALAEMAAELARLKVDAIVTGGTPPTRAAQRVTKTIPIVMVGVGDPVGSGFIASLARPGGNITGITNINVDVNAKRMDLLVTTFPKLSRVAALLNPANPTHAANLAGLQAAARQAKVTLLPVDARTPDEIKRAFSVMKRHNAEALIVHTDQFFIAQARQFADLALKYRLPAIGPREHVEFGGLMSYQANTSGAYRRAASYIDRIFKGAKPAELAVEQPTNFELVINLKTAKALGISVPREVMLRADEVIQ